MMTKGLGMGERQLIGQEVALYYRYDTVNEHGKVVAIGEHTIGLLVQSNAVMFIPWSAILRIEAEVGP